MLTTGWYLQTEPQTKHHCAVPQPPSAQAGRAQGQVIALLQPVCHQMVTGPFPQPPHSPSCEGQTLHTLDRQGSAIY